MQNLRKKVQESSDALPSEPDAALRNFEQRSRLLLDAVRDMVFGLTREGRIVFVNAAARERLGWEAEDLDGQPHAVFHHPREPGGGCVLRAALAEGRVRVVDTDTFWTREGKMLQVEYSLHPEIQSGRCVGMILVARDQGERQELLDRLVSADRLASLGTLAAGVAHEINNPLAYVSSNVEFVSERFRDAEEQDPETRTEISAALNEAREGSQRISRIVADLRTFSLTSSETNTPLDASEVVRAALQLVRHQVRHRAHLVEDLEPVQPVLASRSRLEQVFVNLMLNAAQAIPEGDAARHVVTVRSRMDGHEVVLEVEDTGEGMSREVRQRIFDPFFSTRPIGSSVGMGLAVCHGIVTSVGGAIEVFSAPGKGSLFRVRLPACEPSPPPPPNPTFTRS